MISEELKEQIRTEYLRTDTSLRKLAVKYGIAKTTLGELSRKEGWQTLKYAGVRTQRTPADRTKMDEALDDAAAELLRATDMLRGKVMQLLELEEPLAPRDLKGISGTLLDLKILYAIKTPEERREQEARIRQLEKAVEEKAEGNQTITVFFGNEDEVTADG